MSNTKNTNQKVTTITHEFFGNLEIIQAEGGKVYFPATEAAELLGYTNPRKALIDHCLEEGVTIRDVFGKTGRKAKKYITEGNLYRLIVRSKLPQAVTFERWVFEEVLPEIRANGMYLTEETAQEALEDTEAFLAKAVLLSDDKIKRLEKEVQALAPKAQYCESVLESTNTIPITLIAKDYGMTASELNSLLHDLGIQFFQSGTWLLYRPYDQQGYTNTYTIQCGKTVKMHTNWTQKGRHFLYETLKAEGILPDREKYRVAHSVQRFA